MRDGFVILALDMVDVAEIAEIAALTQPVADFSGDGEGLDGVRDGFIVDVAEISKNW